MSSIVIHLFCFSHGINVLSAGHLTGEPHAQHLPADLRLPQHIAFALGLSGSAI